MIAIVGAVTFVVVDDTSEPTGSAAIAGGGKAAVAGIATVGERAPDFELQTLDGDTVRLSDYAGKPVVVNFWASYCHPCREEFPMFRKALARHDDDFVLLGIDYKDITSDARAFAKEKRATWPILKAPTASGRPAYGVRAVPQTFFIERDGTISQGYYARRPEDLFEQELAKIAKPPDDPPRLLLPGEEARREQRRGDRPHHEHQRAPRSGRRGRCSTRRAPSPTAPRRAAASANTSSASGSRSSGYAMPPRNSSTRNSPLASARLASARKRAGHEHADARERDGADEQQPDREKHARCRSRSTRVRCRSR